MQIASIKAYQVLDSRGEPTIRVRMESASGSHARFDAPSGTSVAKQEAQERRDGEAAYGGQGVDQNIDIITNIIAPKFIGYPLAHQADFDALITALDGTQDRSNLGTNTLTAVSGAYFLLSCYEQKKEVWQAVADQLGTTPTMPRLYANMVAGGSHAPGVEVQEFMAVPQTTSPRAAAELTYELYRSLRSIFQNLYGPSVQLASEEGGMAPLGASVEVVLEALQQFSARAEKPFDIALDMAANHFWSQEGYRLAGQVLSNQQLADQYMQWDQRFPLVSIEDPFAEQDEEGLGLLAAKPGRKFFVAGDDFTATKVERIQQLASQNMIAAVVIKPNQVGTITEMFDAMRAAGQANVKMIVSHRLGESNDTFLADLAYGSAAFGLKLGAPMRGERVSKYNRLIEIEQDTQPVADPATDPASTLVGQTPPVLAPATPAAGYIPTPPAISFNTPPLSAPAAAPTPPLAEKAAHVLHRHDGPEAELADRLGPADVATTAGPHAEQYSPVQPQAVAASQPVSPVGQPAKFPY